MSTDGKVRFPKMIYRKTADGVEHKIVPDEAKLEEALLQGWAKHVSGVDEVPGRTVEDLRGPAPDPRDILKRLRAKK